MALRHYLLVVALLILAVMGGALWASMISIPSSPSNAELIALGGVLLDLAIVGLIVWEDFAKPYLNRPVPRINPILLRMEHYPNEQVEVMGRRVSLFQSVSTELWVNVLNDGRTPIRRMRARAKIVRLPPPRARPPAPARPPEISDEAWTRMTQERQRVQEEMERRIASSQFGRPMPFSRTPRGTVGFPWTEADGRVNYEIDLAPKSDEASVRIFGLFPLSEMARTQLAEGPGVTMVTPPGVRIVATQIGNGSGVAINPTDEGPGQEYAIKFWLVADNLATEVSAILHVEIPSTMDTIVWSQIKKDSPDYRTFEHLLTGAAQQQPG